MTNDLIEMTADKLADALREEGRQAAWQEAIPEVEKREAAARLAGRQEVFAAIDESRARHPGCCHHIFDDIDRLRKGGE